MKDLSSLIFVWFIQEHDIRNHSALHVWNYPVNLAQLFLQPQKVLYLLVYKTHFLSEEEEEEERGEGE